MNNYNVHTYKHGRDQAIKQKSSQHRQLVLPQFQNPDLAYILCIFHEFRVNAACVIPKKTQQERWNSKEWDFVGKGSTSHGNI